jgi:hypothetical protein
LFFLQIADSKQIEGRLRQSIATQSLSNCLVLFSLYLSIFFRTDCFSYRLLTANRSKADRRQIATGYRHPECQQVECNAALTTLSDLASVENKMPKGEKNKTKAPRPTKPYDPLRLAPVDIDEKNKSYLHECLSDKPIGRDNPFPAKSLYRRPNACVALTSNVDGSALNIHHGLKYRLDNFSQNPAFTLLQTVTNPDNTNEPYACFIPIGSSLSLLTRRSTLSR